MYVTLINHKNMPIFSSVILKHLNQHTTNVYVLSSCPDPCEKWNKWNEINTS